MNAKDWPAPEHIRTIRPYVPGKPIEELEREHGIRGSVKLASNENPLGPSPEALAAVQERMGGLHRYPDGSGHLLVGAISDAFGLPRESIVLGNGSDDIISLLTKAFIAPGDDAVLPRPSFLMYEICVCAAGGVPVFVPLRDLALDLDAMVRAVTPRTRMVFLCNPNNPTGSVVHRDRFDAFLAALPEGVIVVVDEAYIEFVRDPDCLQGLERVGADSPVVVLRTFSKLYGLAGLRVGFGAMAPGIAGLLHRIRQPFNVNSLAQAAAAAALGDTAFVRRTLDTVHRGMGELQAELTRMGYTWFPSEANFFMIDVGRSADAVFEEMLRRGVIVRSMRSYGFPRCIRINVGLPEENRRFLAALEAVCGASAGP